MSAVHSRELTIPTDGGTLPATVSLPSGPVRGGLVPLHPASDGCRHQLLFDHLAEVLPPLGIALLRFNRRPASGDDDLPFALQAADALTALEVLRAQPALADVPLGLWGWSQGAWVAPLAAARSAGVAFLVLIAAAGVSPATQMRYGTAEQLRQAGYGEVELTELAQLRAAVEDGLRSGDLAAAQSALDRHAARPWLPLAYVPRSLPANAEWRDMDFDPEPVLADVRCPVLLFYGEQDEWTPIEPSIAAWRRASGVSGNTDVEVVRLAGARHAPTIGGRMDADAISPQYTETLIGWLDRLLPRFRPIKPEWSRA